MKSAVIETQNGGNKACLAYADLSNYHRTLQPNGLEVWVREIGTPGEVKTEKLIT